MTEDEAKEKRCCGPVGYGSVLSAVGRSAACSGNSRRGEKAMTDTLTVEIKTQKCPYCFEGMPYVRRGNGSTITECSTWYYDPNSTCRKCDGKGNRRTAAVKS